MTMDENGRKMIEVDALIGIYGDMSDMRGKVQKSISERRFGVSMLGFCDRPASASKWQMKNVQKHKDASRYSEQF